MLDYVLTAAQEVQSFWQNNFFTTKRLSFTAAGHRNKIQTHIVTLFSHADRVESDEM